MEFGNPVISRLCPGMDTIYRKVTKIPVETGASRHPLQSVMCWHKKPTAYDNLTQCRYKWLFDGNQAKV